MKKTKSFLLALFFSVFLCYGQSVQSVDSKNTKELTSIPQESVYIHYNKSLLFSGESLKYKFYCFDNVKKRLSAISKIGYVSLISKDGQSVFNHKISLDSGLGYSDFFIPTSVPTGSYKLLGYSKWMKNGEVALFFQSDIRIINPYQKLPEPYIDRTVDSITLAHTTSNHVIMNTSEAKNSDRFLKLTIDQSNVGKREKIQMHISAVTANAEKGNYSLSVQKIDSIVSPEKISPEKFFADFIRKESNKALSQKSKTSLPELRGELISGSIVDKTTKLPVKNQKISLSLPGENYLFKVAISNKMGEFHFNFNEKYDNTRAVIQVLSDDWDQYEIIMDDKKLDYKAITFEDFVLSQNMKDHILERSIQNQLENSYQEVKSDSVVLSSHRVPFYRKPNTIYNLDDYTRFNGIPETIVEVIDQVATRNLINGDKVFEVRPEIGLTNDNLLPMVFVDGLFIKRHQDFMGYSAKKVKSISFSREKYLLGTQTFQGILLFKTIRGNYSDDFYTPHIINIDLFKPQPDKQYFAQKYAEGKKQERIPDFRHQLLWLPSIEVSNAGEDISFFTSDVTGDYEVVLEGYTLTGKPVTIKKKITVK